MDYGFEVVKKSDSTAVKAKAVGGKKKQKKKKFKKAKKGAMAGMLSERYKNGGY
jgi:hypothetical protein